MRESVLDKEKLHAMAKTGCVTYKNAEFQLTTALITRSAWLRSARPRLSSKLEMAAFD